jgi:hypothetical protein
MSMSPVALFRRRHSGERRNPVHSSNFNQTHALDSGYCRNDSAGN